MLDVCGAVRAEEECGRPQSAGASVICSPSNYDAATEGNIVYRLANGDGGGFVIRFVDDLSIAYTLEDPNDDRLFFSPLDSERSLYSAVRIETDAEYGSDISVFSSANVISDGRGISVGHHGKSGTLHTEISGGSFSIKSGWSQPHAIDSYTGDGYGANEEFRGDHNLFIRNVSIDSSLSIDEDDDGAWAGGGIVGFHGGEGDFDVAVQDSEITINSSSWTAGVFGGHGGNGDVDVNVQDVTIDVSSKIRIEGIYGFHLGHGNSTINVRDADIQVRGDEFFSNGIIYAYWRKDSTGDLSIDARDVNIQVSGERYLDGIFGRYNGNTGAIDVDVHRADIVVTGADSGGIAFVHDSTGSINIGAREVDIKVEGDRSVGIGGGQRYEGTGDIAISVHDSMITVTGEQVAGIRSFNFSGEGTIDVNVDGGTVTAQGPGSSGILVGLTGRRVGSRTRPVEAPAGVQIPTIDGDGSGDPLRTGIRPQRVVVNGRVRGGGICDSCPGSDAPVVAAGVRMYGGGLVEIGPRGSVGADSGVAVSAEGEGAALRVEVVLDGRLPSEVIMGEIRNDDGRTRIAVNDVTLHDDTGATGAVAPFGARDVSLTASETVAGRVFRREDFVASYAPRAAVYEALSGFMLRLDQREAAGTRLRIPDSPLWIKVAGGQGSYEPDHSHVGAGYDFSHFETEAGVEFALPREGNMAGWASLRHVQGSADVSAPTGGGTIDASGFGGSAGISWDNTDGYYASGSISLTRYETDLRADVRGILKDDVDATVRTFGIEAGRRFLLADRLSITPQAWLTHSDVSMDNFQDTVGSRFSLREAAQSIAGLGVVTETTHVWDDGQRSLNLRGRLGVEQVLGDPETVVEVSGERLGSEADRTRLVLGLGATYHWNRWSLGGEVAASALGSADNHYTASLRLGTQF